MSGRITSKKAAVEPSAENRRERIADAALEVLAEHGARGLTHRAVDRALDLADGSTSFYFRTRSALLLAAAQRLIALDLVDISSMSQDRSGTASLVALWVSPQRRTRSLARLELLLSAARNPELQFMQETRAKFIDRVSRGAQGSSAAAARVTGIALISLVDGLTMQGLLYGKLTRAEVAQVLQKLER
jgi:DNA-binding transcriptional regulator YbjK